MSTMTPMTELTREVDGDDFLFDLDTGSCCAEVGLGGFLPTPVVHQGRNDDSTRY